MPWPNLTRIKGRCRECGMNLSPSKVTNSGYCVNPRCSDYTFLQPWSRIVEPSPDDVRAQAIKDGLL